MPKSKRRRRDDIYARCPLYSRVQSKSKSGLIGVVKKSPSGRYQARIKINGKQTYLGTYDTAKQAAKAHDKEAIKLRRPFSKMNYPKEAPLGYTSIQQPLSSRNTVGYRGVSKSGKKFKASIKIGGKPTTHLGTYDTAKEAAVAYDRAVLKANQSSTLLNFPGMVHNLDVEPKRKKQKVKSTTGYKGIRKLSNGSFLARIKIKGKELNLGNFDTAVAAALAYDQAAIKNGNKSHTLNFPDGLPINDKEKESVKVKDGGYIDVVGGFVIQSYL